MKIKRYDEAEGAKLAFAMCYAFFVIIFAVIMHFVIMIKGWGFEPNWGWLILFWFFATVVSLIKDVIIKTINKVSEY